MYKFFNQIRMLFEYFSYAFKSNYSFCDKIEILKILFSIHFKDIFYRKFHKNNEVTQKIFQYKVTAFDYSALIFLFKEIFLSNEYMFNCKKNDPLIVDCGANIGMSVLYFKKLYPQASIIAFEPNPYAFSLLEQNIKQNKLDNVQLFNIGLSNKKGELDFFMGENKGTLVGSLIQERGGENKLVVKTNTLSDYIRDLKIDLIKMDIEGAEKMVVEDLFLHDMIRRSDKFVIEYHHKIGSDKSEFSQFLKKFEDCKFEYNLKSEFITPGDFQDILLVAFKG